MEVRKNLMMNLLQENTRENLDKINSSFNDKHPNQVIQELLNYFPADRLVMGTGFGAPGVALIDILLTVTRNISIFYLDTDLLFPETYDLRDQLESNYEIKFNRITADVSLQKQADLYGEKLWEKKPDQCCSIRKVQPLKNALENYDVWITGIRRSQTIYRTSSQLIEFEPRFNVIKINPLVNWSHEQVWYYIKTHKIPYNNLHKKGFVSLGCTHCTTPVLNGEDDRAGRWRGFKKSECGLHISEEKKDGKNVVAVKVFQANNLPNNK